MFRPFPAAPCPLGSKKRRGQGPPRSSLPCTISRCGPFMHWLATYMSFPIILDTLFMPRLHNPEIVDAISPLSCMGYVRHAPSSARPAASRLFSLNPPQPTFSSFQCGHPLLTVYCRVLSLASTPVSYFCLYCRVLDVNMHLRGSRMTFSGLTHRRGRAYLVHLVKWLALESRPDSNNGAGSVCFFGISFK